MINEQYKYSALASKIIGCAMTVHSTFGNSFLEVIYQRAMAIEMRLANMTLAGNMRCQSIIGRSKLKRGV